MHMSISNVSGLCTFREDKVHANLMNALYLHAQNIYKNLWFKEKYYN